MSVQWPRRRPAGSGASTVGEPVRGVASRQPTVSTKNDNAAASAMPRQASGPPSGSPNRANHTGGSQFTTPGWDLMYRDSGSIAGSSSSGSAARLPSTSGAARRRACRCPTARTSAVVSAAAPIARTTVCTSTATKSSTAASTRGRPVNTSVISGTTDSAALSCSAGTSAVPIRASSRSRRRSGHQPTVSSSSASSSAGTTCPTRFVASSSTWATHSTAGPSSGRPLSAPAMKAKTSPTEPSAAMTSMMRCIDSGGMRKPRGSRERRLR
jgi:hypothetical protein